LILPAVAGGGPRWEAWAAAYLRISGWLLRTFSVLVVATMTVLNAVNITSRALFNVDLEWTQELLMIAAMGLYFLSVALISKGNMDIRIDAVLRILPRSWQLMFGVLSRLAALAFQCTVLWLAIDTIGFVSVFHTPVLEISEGVFFVPVIAGAADMAITEAIYLARQLRGTMGAPGTGLAQ
jgi:TRAP-type C4-dicarboxylate transport system permease small subunit